MAFFSGVKFVLFCFVFVSMLLLKPRNFVQSSIDMQASRWPHVFLSFSFFLFVYLEMSLFPSIFFVPFPISLCTESTLYVLSFRVVFFLPCDHGLDF